MEGCNTILNRNEKKIEVICGCKLEGKEGYT
jgi:hypothetical protein